jgi:hypothetical protein
MMEAERRAGAPAGTSRERMDATTDVRGEPQPV